MMAEPPRASRPPTPVFALAPGLLSLAPRSRPHHPGTQQEPPIKESGKLVGGIGVSGGTYQQDQDIAEAALRALGFELPA